MPITTLAQVFPLLLAPAVIAWARRQKPLAFLDGALLVWTCVIGAAVLWTALIDLATGVSLGLETAARGLLCGVVSTITHTLLTGKGRSFLPRPTINPPDPDIVALKPSADAILLPASALPTPPASSAAPTVFTLPAPDLDFSAAPRPSEPR